MSGCTMPLPAYLASSQTNEMNLAVLINVEGSGTMTKEVSDIVQKIRENRSLRLRDFIVTVAMVALGILLASKLSLILGSIVILCSCIPIIDIRILKKINNEQVKALEGKIPTLENILKQLKEHLEATRHAFPAELRDAAVRRFEKEAKAILDLPTPFYERYLKITRITPNGNYCDHHNAWTELQSFCEDIIKD